MRFLIIPWADHFQDRNMLRGLARALRKAGHETILLSRPLVGWAIVRVCRDLGIDVVFDINRARPPDLPANIRHIAWFQDPVVPRDIADRVRDSDVVYRISDVAYYNTDVKGHCRTGFLFLAADEAAIEAFVPPASQTVDFSFCGNIPSVPPSRRKSSWEEQLWRLSNRIGRIPIVGESIVYQTLLRRFFASRMPAYGLPLETFEALFMVVDAYYRPLVGEVDREFLIGKMRETVAPHLGGLSNQMAAVLESTMSSIAFTQPRVLDRAAVVENILRVTDSVELYGAGWNKHPQFTSYHKGVLTGPQALFSVYARSRLNGTNTLGGFGLHVRNLECMAVGGFLFTHSSKNDENAGGLRTSFEPGVHYGECTPDNIQEEALRWIRDGKERDRAGARAAVVVRDKHLWRHRAEQIIRDLQDRPAGST